MKSRRVLRAERWFGAAGVEALAPSFVPQTSVMEFYAHWARQWLALEVPGLDAVFRAPNRILVGSDYQLRLAPTACRWILLQRRTSGWELLRPSKTCVSLVDWLAQVRRRV